MDEINDQLTIRWRLYGMRHEHVVRCAERSVPLSLIPTSD
jgi:hypothetical protein